LHQKAANSARDIIPLNIILITDLKQAAKVIKLKGPKGFKDAKYPLKSS